MNIYFGGAIRGGREDAKIYSSLIQFLQSYGTVLTEHVGSEKLLQREEFLSEEDIFQRDMQWLEKADVFIAEVTTPSLGVGYELAAAEKRNIPCFCLFRKHPKKTLSAMIGGNPFFQVTFYNTLDEAQDSLSKYLHNFTESSLEWRIKN
jgi:2'-deoxynucleoside 5'-phosphate N-hydrolase